MKVRIVGYMGEKISQDPQMILQTAIAAINVFTQSEAFDFQDEQRLVAKPISSVQKVLSIVHYYTGPFFSHKKKQRLHKIKTAILQARDIIQCYMP